MPEKTLEAFADHGEVKGDVVTGKGGRGAARCSTGSAGRRRLRRRVRVLETEGVDKFKKSWHELVETVQGQMDRETGTE